MVDGWDKFGDENGQPYERTLRTMEAYLMTARKYGLPVQFNFFAFLPEVLGGANPYLDPAAVRQQTDADFVCGRAFSRRSISRLGSHQRAQLFAAPVDECVRTATALNSQNWNEWLNKRYPDRAKLAALWNVPTASVQGSIPFRPKTSSLRAACTPAPTRCGLMIT